MSVKLAVIGGSRAYDLLAKSCFKGKKKASRSRTPFGMSSPVHQFKYKKTAFYFLSRHGEKGYEVTAPYVNYRANIWALKKLGVERIVSWSQPGSIKPSIYPGDFCIPNDLIDFTRNRESTFFKNMGLGFIRMENPFCPEIRESLAQSFNADSGPEFHPLGVYICTEGPRLETPSEIKMFSAWGADLVGMTLATEAFLARELEICYASICLSSNFAEGVKARNFRKGELFEGMLSDGEKEKVESSVMRLPEIVSKAMEYLSGMKRECDCGYAMERYRKSGRLKKDLLAEIKSKLKK